jgi:uncharacterized protein (TIGR00297 family)
MFQKTVSLFFFSIFLIFISYKNRDYLLVDDIKYTFGYLLIISFVIKILDIFRKKDILTNAISRKILHIIACIMIAYSPFIIENIYLNLSLFGLVFIIVSLIHNKNILKPFTVASDNYGIILLPLSYVIIYGILGFEYREIVKISYLILGISDGLAGLTGMLFANKFYKITKDTKSYLGSVVFLITSLAIFYWQLNDKITDTQQLRLTILLLAYLLTAIEAASSYGLDNLFVPIVTSLMLYVLSYNENYFYVYNLHINFFISTLAAYLSYKFKFLKKDGAFGAFILAFALLSFGSWKWIIPVLTFFFLSSILSKLREKVNNDVELNFEKSDTRDIYQVFANGGLGIPLVLLYYFYNNEIFYIAFVVFIAAATADTWATEIGTMFKTTTYSIKNFKKVKPGVSGGVSYVGTFGSFLGATLISFTAYLYHQNFKYFIIIALLGFAGSIIDSLIGAFWQNQNICTQCHSITERKVHCGIKTEHNSGVHWLNNDLVNFISNFIVSLLIFLTIL